MRVFSAYGVFETFGVSCETSFPEPQLLCRLGLREVFTDHSLRMLSLCLSVSLVSPGAHQIPFVTDLVSARDHSSNAFVVGSSVRL